MHRPLGKKPAHALLPNEAVNLAHTIFLVLNGKSRGGQFQVQKIADGGLHFRLGLLFLGEMVDARDKCLQGCQ